MNGVETKIAKVDEAFCVAFWDYFWKQPFAEAEPTETQAVSTHQTAVERPSGEGK